MTNENQKPQPFSMSDIVAKEMQSVLDNQAGINGYKNAQDFADKTKHDLQNLILTKDDLKQIKVLDKPTDTATRLVWIIHTIVYEYAGSKSGCHISLFEMGLNRHSQEIKELSKTLEQAGYKVNLCLNNQIYGDCLEVFWNE